MSTICKHGDQTIIDKTHDSSAMNTAERVPLEFDHWKRRPGLVWPHRIAGRDNRYKDDYFVDILYLPLPPQNRKIIIH